MEGRPHDNKFTNQMTGLPQSYPIEDFFPPHLLLIALMFSRSYACDYNLQSQVIFFFLEGKITLQTTDIN